MSYVQRLTVAILTDGAGAATVYTQPFTGKVSAIRYVKDGSNPLDNTADVVGTVGGTGEAVWSESNLSASLTRAPRQATHGIDGSASLYAAAGEPVEAMIAVANDRLKFVFAQGGAAKVGTLYVVVE